jgi:cell division protein FtsB
MRWLEGENSKLMEDNAELKEENVKLKDNTAQLKETMVALKDENQKRKDVATNLWDANVKLTVRNTTLEDQSAKLTDRNTKLEGEVVKWKNEVAKLENLRKNEEEELIRLRVRVSELNEIEVRRANGLDVSLLFINAISPPNAGSRKQIDPELILSIHHEIPGSARCVFYAGFRSCFQFIRL